MKRRELSVVISLAVALAMAAASGPALAQMASALGKPLPVSTLSTGTVSVRVIAGAPDKPLIGVDVVLVSSDGTQRIARSDAEGRATFTELAPGSRWVARAQEPEGGEARSDEFAIPSQGGLRLMISTRPFQEPAAAAGAGAGAMDPRRMSGVPRGDPAVAAGEMTVAAVRGSVAGRLVDHDIHLIGYGVDGSVTRITRKTDAEGRAAFPGLRSRTVAYYAMTTFTRGGAAGRPLIIDRVRSDQVSLPPNVGVRLMLAGLPEDSTEPGAEDLARIAVQASPMLGVDDVLTRLTFTAQARVPQSVSLFEILEGDAPPRLVGTAPVQPPLPADVAGTIGHPMPQPELDAGTVLVQVIVNGPEPSILSGVPVQLVSMVDGRTTEPALTDDQGMARFTGLVPGSNHRVVIKPFGEVIQGAPLAVPADGGLRVTASLDLQVVSSADALFRGVAPDRLYFVEAELEGRPHRSPPFQTIPGRGAIVGMIIHDKPLMSFHLNGWIEDKYMGFSGQLSLYNTSAAPVHPGLDGVLIPLPKGFIGGRVEEDMAAMVKVIPGEGLLWRGPLPPGSVQFNAGFSLPVADGQVPFDLDLPLGVFGSSVILLKTPGMQLVNLPMGMRGADRQMPDGRTFYMINQISIQEGQRMVFTITGLPQVPKTQFIVSLLVGAMVLAFLGWALTTIFAQPRRAAAAASSSSDQARARKLARWREELLDELVALETRKKSGEITGEAYSSDRAKLRKHLESVYAEIESLSKDRSAA